VGSSNRCLPGWEKKISVRMAAWRGAIETPFMPSFVLFATFLGFGAMARQSGLSMFESLFASIFIFALPAMMVLVDQMSHGASIATAALAVTATGVRLLPLVVAIVPLIRYRNVPKWVEYLIAYFTAVTMWVETLRRLPMVPRHLRAAYSIGIALNIVPSATAGALIGYVLATGTPVIVTAALLFLAPLYFMLSMLVCVRDFLTLLPIAIGVVLGPIFYLLAPQFDLLLTGLIGGTISFLVTTFFSHKQSNKIKSQCPASSAVAEANMAQIISAIASKHPPVEAEATSLNGSAPSFTAGSEGLRFPATTNAIIVTTADTSEKQAALEDTTAWYEFMAAPADYADRARLAACLDHSFGINKKLMNGRLHNRLSTLLTLRYGLPTWIAPENCDELDRTIALASAKHLQTIIQRADEIYRSPAVSDVATEVEVETNAETQEAETEANVGVEIEVEAENEEFQSEQQDCQTTNGVTVGVVSENPEEEKNQESEAYTPTEDTQDSNTELEYGLRCFAAWCDTLPYGVGARVRLKLPASPILDEMTDKQFHTEGAAIVRQVASQIMA
jgi:predicted branched-subunit amino acid permease